MIFISFVCLTQVPGGGVLDQVLVGESAIEANFLAKTFLQTRFVGLWAFCNSGLTVSKVMQNIPKYYNKSKCGYSGQITHQMRKSLPRVSTERFLSLQDIHRRQEHNIYITCPPLHSYSSSRDSITNNERRRFNIEMKVTKARSQIERLVSIQPVYSSIEGLVFK